MNQQIYEEASEWIVRNRDGDLPPQEKIEFDRWLRESPQHVCAYLEMTSVLEGVGSLDPQDNPDATALIAMARTDRNVVALDVAAKQVTQSPAPRHRGRLAGIGLATAAAILLVCACAWLFIQRDTYSTGTG